MISKNQLKEIRALSVKKFRDEKKLFVAEGEKLVGDLFPYFECKELYVTNQCQNNIFATAVEVSQQEMKQMSQLSTPSSVLAVFKQPEHILAVDELKQELILVLDEVQNPGNLGTIIRIADWFGIHHIVCSLTTADVFSPKTVQATMGALARVNVHYCDLAQFLTQYKKLGLPIYGTFLDGTNMYEKELQSVGAIIMGNEGNGVSSLVASFVDERLLIPNYPQGVATSESLNVAVATAIICSEFRRR